MRGRLFAEAAFQIVIFLIIVTIGWGAAMLLTAANVTGARLIGSAISIILIMTMFLK
jgi:hypothetical protein